MLKEFSAQGPEQAREAASRIFGLENSRKAYEGRLPGSDRSGGVRQEAEGGERLQGSVMANAQWKAAYGNAWTEIADGREEGRVALQGTVFSWARFVAGEPGADRSFNMSPRSRSRMASACPASTIRSSIRCASSWLPARRSTTTWRSRG